MARGSFFAGIMKSGALAAALLAGAAVPGYAEDAPKLALTGSAVITTDYMFRSISNTNQNPAAQVEFDLTYGIFWSYIWSIQYRIRRKHRGRLRCRHLAEMGPAHIHLRRLLVFLSG